MITVLALSGCATGSSPSAAGPASSPRPTAVAGSSPAVPAPSAGTAIALGDYDAARDSAADIGKALAAAKKSGRNVLIDFGADWCLDCRVLTELSTDPSVAAQLTKGYEVVSVDVGEFDRNLDVAADWGVNLRSSGIPALVVLSPAGKVKVATNDGSFAGASSMAPADVSAFLTRWAPAAP
ncbi:thioredoxin family protein [Actinoplanes sp. NEAU-A12]|uniref:Thioredoxin family protein n=1 Tax=Actinoplanes sandaracinus TaxID=3045177 RepID=A0ABT6WXP9_9ACTN|nr:thioredoxin family protein [Actinoplanes sandaracinus]